MRTLVISDLHLGARTGTDVLRSPEDRQPLLELVSSCRRLVLLGDVLELRHGPLQEALEAAQPVLGELGAALGSAGEAVIVPGNHDHHLLEPWSERRGEETLDLETSVSWEQGEPLGLIAKSLAPATVRAAYPGVWLRDDVYAIHGHYADRHTTVPIVERLGAGLMARVMREREGGPRCAEDYEAMLAPMYAWFHAMAQYRPPLQLATGSQTQAWQTLTGNDDKRSLRRRAMVAAFPVAVATISRVGFGPLRAEISGPELRRASLQAFVETLRRLQVRAPHVIFGHTHRAGPLPRDDHSEWRAPSGAALTNTGSWVREQAFLRSDPRSPYRPGFVALVDDRRSPELLNVLDGVPAPASA